VRGRAAQRWQAQACAFHTRRRLSDTSRWQR